MSLRSKLAQRARPYLAPDEQIQAVFMAQSGLSPYWGSLVGLLCLIPVAMVYTFKMQTTAVGMVLLWILIIALVVCSKVSFRIHHFVVTDQAISVIDASQWRPTFPARLRQRYPRTLYFGSRTSGLWRMFDLDNNKYWVRSRFQKDAAAADAALTAMTQRGGPSLAVAAPSGQQPGGLPPAGWYPDPAGGSDKRYWNGEQWAPVQQERFR